MNERFWTVEADEAILAGRMTDADLAVELARSVKAIRLRRWRLKNGRANPDWLSTTGRRANQLADVWRYVETGAPDACWPWIGAKRRRGYGAFTLDRKNIVAHRAAFQAATGIDPGKFLVCHSCDNPPCCNPAHLFLGTNTDNVRDMLEKGRARPPRGEQHHRAKLTVKQVREIRARRAAGEKLIDLAAEFGIGAARLSVIVNHPDKAWSHA